MSSPLALLLLLLLAPPALPARAARPTSSARRHHHHHHPSLFVSRPTLHRHRHHPRTTAPSSSFAVTSSSPPPRYPRPAALTKTRRSVSPPAAPGAGGGAEEFAVGDDAILPTDGTRGARGGGDGGGGRDGTDERTSPPASSPPDDPPGRRRRGVDDRDRDRAPVGVGDILRRIDREHRADSVEQPFAAEGDDGRESWCWAEAAVGVGVVSPGRRPGREGGGCGRRAAAVAFERLVDPVANRTVAVRSDSDSERRQHPPVLDAASVAVIRGAAEELWRERRRQNGGGEGGTSGTSSRFTYQRPGNSEAHLADLMGVDPAVRGVVDDALLHRIYPLLRDAFFSGKGHPLLASLGDDRHRLAVYDALVIRYDADEARRLGSGGGGDGGVGGGGVALAGAGQPLHRDLGLCSVNVALNSADEYEGGGTFFENLIADDDRDGDGGGREVLAAAAAEGAGAVVRIPTAGHLVAHPCAERHAGVATTGGVRDILVIFVTARDVVGGTDDFDDDDVDVPPATDADAASVASVTPRIERGARLRGEAARSDDDARLRRALYRAAIVENPRDGEAWQFLGMSMLADADGAADGADAMGRTDDGCGDVGDVVPSPSHRTLLRRGELDAAVRCLERAELLCPRDGRVANNLGLALRERRRFRRLLPEIETDHDRHENENENGEEEEEEEARMERCFRRAVFLNDVASGCGVDVGVDRDAATLNLGLLLADRDDFAAAAAVLGTVRGGDGDGDVADDDDGDVSSPSTGEVGAADYSSAAARVVRDAARLRRFCEGRMPSR